MENKEHVLSQHVTESPQEGKMVVFACSCGNWGGKIGPIGDDDDSLAQATLDGNRNFRVDHLRPKGLELHVTEERDAT